MAFNDKIVANSVCEVDFFLDDNFVLWCSRGEDDCTITTDGRPWWPQRRILPPEIILQELKKSGFEINECFINPGEHGEPDLFRVICT